MLNILTASFIIMCASLAGVFFIWKEARTLVEKNLHLLVSFSAGVFLIVAYNLGEETLEKAPSLANGLFWIIIGILIFWIAFKFMPDFHHHHNEKQKDHTHSDIDARRILTSDAVHNMGDGILLATSFTVSFTLGVLTTLSIFVHELVQEISEFFVLRHAGLRAKKALALNFLVSGTILIGAVGSYFLLETFQALEVPLLGIATGSFLIVVLQDLIPHSIKTSTTVRHYLNHLVWFALGISLMFILNGITLPH